MQFQNLHYAKSRIEKAFQANRRSGKAMPGLSRIFKMLRKHSSFTLFGDYPLMRYAVCAMREMGATITRDHIWRALRFSNDYQGIKSKKEKMEMMTVLNQ